MGWMDQACLFIQWPWIPPEAGVWPSLGQTSSLLPLLDLLWGKTMPCVKQPARNQGAIKRTFMVSNCVFKNKGASTDWENCGRDYAYSVKLYIHQPEQFCDSVFVQTVLLCVFHPNYQCLLWEQTNPKAARMHFNVICSLSQQNHLGHISFSIHVTFGYATGLKFKIYYLRTSFKNVLWTVSMNPSLLTFGNLLCVQPRLSEKTKHNTSVPTGDLYHINNAASPWKAPVLEKEEEREGFI